MDRREFVTLLPALLAATALYPEAAHAQQAGTMDHPVMGEPTPGPQNGNKPKGDVPLPILVSGVYTPGAGYGSLPKRKSHRYMLGMLKAGNIQLELHETIQEPGALHEASEKHLHNELWFVKEGTCELTINGVTRRMNPGDVGLVTAGDYHYIRNAGNTQCTYFVVTLGPPEQYT
jgi:mannose-6-phosphate isomerase-like protein (cupin superfamily)